MREKDSLSDNQGITDVFVQPDLRRKRLTVTVSAVPSGRVRLSIDGTEHSVEGPVGKLSLPFPDFTAWSPSEPRLYTLTCELMEDDAVLDTTSVRFGMREFTIRDGRFFLNYYPIHIKGVVHCGDDSESNAESPITEVARADLEVIKDAGFNLILLRQGPAPASFFDLCDEMGILVWHEVDPVVVPRSEFGEKVAIGVRQTIQENRNRPSIVVWGFCDHIIADADGIAFSGAERSQVARGLDPSRVIIVDPMLGTCRLLVRPYHTAIERCEEICLNTFPPVSSHSERYARTAGSPDVLTFHSGAECPNLIDLSRCADDLSQLDAGTIKQVALLREHFSERELERAFGSFEGFVKARHAIQREVTPIVIDALRANEKSAGYICGSLSDYAGSSPGEDSKLKEEPKPIAAVLGKTQAPMRPLISMPRTNFVPRDEIDVTVTLANDERYEGPADLSLQVVGPTNQVLWKKKRSVKIVRSRKPIWTGKISASGSEGKHKFLVRVMRGGRIVAEGSTVFHVVDRPEPAQVAAQFLDPKDTWEDRCAPYLVPMPGDAAIQIIPPFANTIRAYPEHELAQVLASVREGAVAIFFDPPDDWNELAEAVDDHIMATSRGVGTYNCFDYVKLHPVFDQLPTRCCMGQIYRDVAPGATFIEASDEDICGALNTDDVFLQSIDWGKRCDPWSSHILVRRFGSGRIVFTHLNILENLDSDPVAARLFVNLLNHFNRRSVPPEGEVQPLPAAAQWMGIERKNVRRWKVIGPFPNWDGAGHDTVYPPEKSIDFEGTYPGWFETVTWEDWRALPGDAHRIHFGPGAPEGAPSYPVGDGGCTMYAYAEFTCEKRQRVACRVESDDPVKIWLNGVLAEAEEETDGDPEITIRQGRNTVLIKISIEAARSEASFDLLSQKKESVPLTWWK
jgi:hypothetical protein